MTSKLNIVTIIVWAQLMPAEVAKSLWTIGDKGRGVRGEKD
jgi:hypothetical protein